MAGDIVLSGSVRSNLLSLQNTADLMSRTQNRLATGKKVNSALDNPTNFFIAGSLTNRATDISNLLDGVGTAMKVLEGADNGIKAITRLVENAQATARQAQQSTATTSRLLGNNTTALTGTQALSGLVSGTNDFIAGSTIQISSGTNKTTTLTITATTTVNDIINVINDNSGVAAAVDNVDGTVAVGSVSGAEVRATLTADGKIQLEGINAGATIGLTFNRGTNGATSGEMRTAIGLLGFDQTGGTYTEGTAGTAPTFTTAITAAGTNNVTRQTLANQYNELRNQIDKLAGDATYNGVNLLQSDALKVIFNEHTTSYLTINGVDFDSSGLAVAASGNNFQTDYDINKALDQLGTALTTLRSQSSTFGSNLSVVQTRQEFMKSMINTLKTGSDQLVLADTNEEGANMLALQTRQQLSSTALSLASQAEQQVLRLFG